jgi:endonuclease/exonuclease/phosphatase family metal-dependent hydrolase
MTFNLRFATAADGENHWVKRRPILFACLQQHPPGIMATQEGLDFQLDEIKTSLPGFDYFGQGRYLNVPLKQRPHEHLCGEHCALFYDTRQFELLHNATFWLSDTPEIPGSATWGNDLPRVVTWGIFRPKHCQQAFAVFNTHYHWGEPFISNSTKLLIQKISEIADALPTILAGDFNLPPDSTPYRMLTRHQSAPEKFPCFIDVWNARGQTEAAGNSFHGFDGVGKERIDWLLVTRQFAVRTCERIEFAIDGRFPSDHFPIAATVVLNEKNKIH